MDTKVCVDLFLDKRDVIKAMSREGLICPMPPNVANIVVHIQPNGLGTLEANPASASA